MTESRVELPDISEARDIYWRLGARRVERAEVTLNIEILEVPPQDVNYHLPDALDIAGFDPHLNCAGAEYVNRLGTTRIVTPSEEVRGVVITNEGIEVDHSQEADLRVIRAGLEGTVRYGSFEEMERVQSSFWPGLVSVPLDLEFLAKRGRERRLVNQGQAFLTTIKLKPGQTRGVYSIVGAKSPEDRVPEPLEHGFYDAWLGDLWEVLEPALDEEAQGGLVGLVQVPFSASMMDFAGRHQYKLESRRESIGRDAQSFVTTDLMQAKRIIMGSRLISHHMSCASIYEEGAQQHVVTESPALCVHLKKVPGLSLSQPVALAIPGVAYMRSDGGVYAREDRDEMGPSR